MKNICSVHTHSTMCDGESTLAEMARAAWEAGAVSFGASGHSHTPIPEDGWTCCWASSWTTAPM